MNRWFITIVIGVWLLWVTPAIAANTIFSDDFESGNLAAWSNCPAGSPVINQVQSTTKHAGTYALKIDIKNSAGTNYNPCINSPTPSPTASRTYVSFWVNWGNTYSCYNHWWRMFFANGAQLDFAKGFRPCRFAGTSYDLSVEFLESNPDGGSAMAGWILKDPFVNLATSTPLVNGDSGSQIFAPVILTGWHRLEMLILFNTPGVSDGTVKTWFDGVAYIDTDNAPTPFEDEASFGIPKRPRGSYTFVPVDLQIMTNSDIGHPAADCNDKPQPCHDTSLDYFLYVDDVLWADECPDTGATCSVGVETTVKGKSIRIMEWFIIMMMVAGFVSLLAQLRSLVKPKMIMSSFLER